MDTPSGAAVHNLKPPGRKLWNSKKDDGWDNVRSSQFVNFADVPETDDDSFFGNHKVIVSTPKVYGKPGCSTHSYHENTLIQSLEASPISMIGIVPSAEEWKTDEDHSAFEHQITVIQMDTNEPEHCTKATEKPKIPTIKVQCRNQDVGKPKPTLIKKKLEEGKHLFRAKPVPKYLIARKMELNKDKTDSAEKMDCGVVGQEHNLQCPPKNKENTEVWKKPAFLPAASQKNVCRPKSPPLRTKGRAEARKTFDQTVKSNEEKVKLQRQMDLEAKREQEEKEIALLRKRTVHKAQPVRKYKQGLPTLKKRPLTEPQTPVTLKRQKRY